MTTQIRTSSVPTCKGVLFDNLAASPDLVGVRVDYSWDDRFPENEYVAVGDLRDRAIQKWASLGRRDREEEYELDIHVRAGGPSSSQREATERAFQILAFVEVAVRADEKLGLGTGGTFQWLTTEVSGFDFTEAPLTDGGSMTFITWSLHIIARI